MTQKPEPRKFYKTSFEDDEWLDQQSGAVLKLFRECAKADPFGDEAPIVSSLKRTAFFAAKKVLEQANICQFRQAAGDSDGRKTQWFVTYLHGSNNKDYWKGFATTNCNPEPTANSENIEFSMTNCISATANSNSVGANSSLAGASDLSLFSSSLDFNQTESDKLTNYHENPSVSLVSDSLRSTQSTESLSKQDPSSSNETTPPPDNLFYHQAVFLEEDTRTDYWHGKEMENRSSVQQHEGSVMSYITPQISRTFSAAELPREAPSPDLTIQSHTNHPQDALSDPLAPADETLDLEVELECLAATIKGVLWDINGTISPGLPEVLERFKSLATTTRLLPVSENCPEYERMNGFVEMKNYELVMSLSTNGEIKRVAFGHISYQ